MRTFLVITILLLFLIGVSAQDMPRLVPEAYWGTAFIDGNPAPKGSVITVEAMDDGEIVGESKVIDNIGRYSLDVIFDNDLTEADEGAEEGQKLMWKLNELTCTRPKPSYDEANSGNVNQNFSISATAGRPTPNTTTSAELSGDVGWISSFLWLLPVSILAFALILLFISRKR